MRCSRTPRASTSARTRCAARTGYAKRPFAEPEQVFKYLGRYTHRVGISNHRLVSFDEHGVCFHTKNGKQAKHQSAAHEGKRTGEAFPVRAGYWMSVMS